MDYDEDAEGELSTSEIDLGEEVSEFESDDDFESWYRGEEQEEELQDEPPIRYSSKSCVLKTSLPQSTTSWRLPSYHEGRYQASSKGQVTIGPTTTTNRLSSHVVPGSLTFAGFGSLIFSGSSKNPDVYLRWETNMEKWLRANKISKEHKLSYAIDGLVGDAYKWWEQEETHNNKPVYDWEGLKAKMYKKFVLANALMDIQVQLQRLQDSLLRVTQSPPEQLAQPIQEPVFGDVSDKEESPPTPPSNMSLALNQATEESAPMVKITMSHDQPQKSSPEEVTDPSNGVNSGMVDGVITALLRGVVSRDHERVIDSFQLKEEPPDQRLVAQPHTYAAQQQECHQSFTEKAYELRLVMEPKVNALNIITTWIVFLPHLGNHWKKNQLKISSQEKAMVFTRRKNTDSTCFDIRALKEGFRPNLKELNCEVKFSRILTQNGFRGGWIQVKRSSELGDMHFAIQWLLTEHSRELNNVGALQTYVWHPGACKPPEEIHSDILMPHRSSKVKWDHLYVHISRRCLFEKLCKNKLVHRGAATWKPSRSLQGFPFCPGWSLPKLLPSVPTWNRHTSLVTPKDISLGRWTCYYQLEAKSVSPLGDPDQVSTTLTSLTILDSRAVIEESICLGLVEKSLEDTWHEKSKTEIAFYLLRGMTPHAFDVSSLGASMTAITHLCLVKSVKVLADTMGVIAKIRGSPHTYQLKEEPPDFGVPFKATKGLQGKSHSPSAFYEPNLVYIGVGTMVVWRSKPFQEGGNDVVITSEPIDNTMDQEGHSCGSSSSMRLGNAEKMAWSTRQDSRERFADAKSFRDRVKIGPDKTCSRTERIFDSITPDPMSSSSGTCSLGDKVLCVLTSHQ